MMNEQELLNVLKECAYIVKQHIGMVTGVEQTLPIRVYDDLTRAINNLEPTPTQKEDKRLLIEDSLKDNTNNKEKETNTQGASVLLLQSGLLVDKQVRHPNNQYFIKECNTFINDYGQERFNSVLNRTKQAKAKTKIKNIYSYIHQGLVNEMKRGLN